jgi:ADP-ribose pyrophosphatase YjhB (NUDIX family)
MKIEELGPPGADHSTGLILHWRDRLLFALLPVSQWRDSPAGKVAHVAGIGGHLEAGESWAHAVRREAREEADVDITLRSPAETWLLRDDGTVQDITPSLEWPAPPRPLFIWSARFGMPPDGGERHFVNAVFDATLAGDVEPHPAAEMPAILALTHAQLHEMAERPTLLERLLSEGAVLWERLPVPRTMLIAPWGTAWWYHVWRQSVELAAD